MTQEFAELVFDIATSLAVAADLTTLARTLRTHAASGGEATLQIVRGDEHAELMRLCTGSLTMLRPLPPIGVASVAAVAQTFPEKEFQKKNSRKRIP
jgi:hypothetical protein